LHLENDRATSRLGAALAAHIAPGMKIYLKGDLGAGKTTMVRGMLRALGVQDRVKSPTYTLVEVYVVSKLNFYHFDFYRFRDPNEFLESGFRDYFGGEATCLVEWPEKALGLLPQADVEIELTVAAEGRDCQLSAYSEIGEKCLTKLREGYS
jgi:tRNA threonylcarbamoyladenosine biosynthesis protein TsaE